MTSPDKTTPARAVRGVASVHGPLVTWARRSALVAVVLAPFLEGFLVAPCVIGALIYGHLGQLKRRGGVSADSLGVRLNGVLMIPRATFSFAFSLDRGNADPTICFVRGGDVVAEVTVEDATARDQILDALGFGAEGSPIRAEGALSPELRAGVALVGAILSGFAFSISARHESIGGMIVMGLMLALSAALFLRRDMRLGRDGVWVAAPFRRHWVPFDELRGVSRAGLWLRLHTTRGDVDVSPPLSWPSTRARGAREALATAIRRAAARYERSPRADDVADSRRGDTQLAPREGSFRERALTSEDLLRIVEDPRSSCESRVRAAAGLLGGAPTDEQRAVIRCAAEESASPSVQRALQLALAAEDEAALEDVVSSVARQSRQACKA